MSTILGVIILLAALAVSVLGLLAANRDSRKFDGSARRAAGDAQPTGTSGTRPPEPSTQTSPPSNTAAVSGSP
ncbi:hypothetical protein SAMN04488047_101403 [Tranquillimonas alkanivorans]|uniref:Uncharacterized protein n=1 Tax=Tranquillimonas alkanivorans TaxID=441119 RepID=A0A1I5L0H4_9RHOB|nr:hypothetical protein SAMN04488047_101403 [Tranquillimonas alkanivorans]